jgi:hypothetical protein
LEGIRSTGKRLLFRREDGLTMAMVFQCDRCKEIGKKHASTITINRVRNGRVVAGDRVVSKALCVDCDTKITVELLDNDLDRVILESKGSHDG